jgi:hypothetical protein
MSDRLAALRAERDVLEQAGTYEGAVYSWLLEEIEALEAQEPANPPAPAPAATPEATSASDRIAALEREFAEAMRHPERLSDQQHSALLERLNVEVRRVAREADGEAADASDDTVDDTVDVAELGAQMRAAIERGNALDPAEAGRLVQQLNRAVRHQVTHVTASDELRGLLQGQDVTARFEAGAELARRGLLPDDMAARMVAEVNGMAREAAAAGPLDPARVPAELRDLATRMRDQLAADEAAMRGQVDPRDELTGQINALIRQASEDQRGDRLTRVGAYTATEPTEDSA